MIKNKNNQKGLSLVSVLVGVFLLLVVFLGIFGAYRLIFVVINRSYNRITSNSIATDEIERIRNLPYEDVGVEGSYPDGVLKSTSTEIRNNKNYEIKRRVDYVIDSTDGTGAPEDSCPNDYKKVKIEVLWDSRYSNGEVIANTNVAPNSLAEECANKGGILGVSVFDAYGEMISSPLIEVLNPETGDKIKSTTPDKGETYFSVPTSTYKVTVSKNGYSSSRTYGTDEIANPEKPHPLLSESEIEEISFSIDEISTMVVKTLFPWGTDYWGDDFNDQSGIYSSSNIGLNNKEVALFKKSGIYFEDGNNDQNITNFPGNSGNPGQSFTIGEESRIITDIKLFLAKATSSPSDIYLEVRSNATTGPILSTSSSQVGSNLPINLEWINFSFPKSVKLNANTKYFLNLRSIPKSNSSSSAKGPINWGFVNTTSSPPGYDEGEAFRFLGTENSEKISNIDFSFKVYSDQYEESGHLISTSVEPTNLQKWDQFSFIETELFNTDIKHHIYYASGTDWKLIPDSDLNNNLTGFDNSPIDLSCLSTSTYSKLRIKTNLNTSVTTSSPTFTSWQFSWLTGSSTPISDAQFNLRGNKKIGTDGEENSVYKYSISTTTNSVGEKLLENLEWDQYYFLIPTSSSLSLTGTNPSPQPIGLEPGSSTTVNLFLETENSLILTVQNEETLDPIFSAETKLYNNGISYSQTKYTDEQGKVNFAPLEEETYNLTISATGYKDASTTISVSGDNTQTIKLEQVE